MKFTLTWASNLNKEEELNVKTLDDLMKIVKREGSVIIHDSYENPTIIIYDDYVE